jgi:hypothetical protein
MTEGNYSNVGHRGPVYKGLGAMNPCDNLSYAVTDGRTVCSMDFLAAYKKYILKPVLQ